MHIIDGFIDVYRSDTGEKMQVPAHYMDHPILSKLFRKTPKQRAEESPKPPEQPVK